jgi:hypothetical protein
MLTYLNAQHPGKRDFCMADLRRQNDAHDGSVRPPEAG